MNLKNKITVATLGLTLAISNPAKAESKKTGKTLEKSKAKIENILSKNKTRLVDNIDNNTGTYETVFIRDSIPELSNVEKEEKLVILDSYMTQEYLSNLNKYFISVEDEKNINSNLRAQESIIASKKVISQKKLIEKEIIFKLKKFGLINNNVNQKIVIKGDRKGKKIFSKIFNKDEFFVLFINKYFEDEEFDKNIYLSNIEITLQKNKSGSFTIKDFNIIKGDFIKQELNKNYSIKISDYNEELKKELGFLSQEIIDTFESFEVEENVTEKQKKESINYLETRLVEMLKKYHKNEEMLIFGYNFYKEVKPVESKRIGYLKMMKLLGFGEELIEDEILEPYSNKLLQKGFSSFSQDELKIAKIFSGFFKKYLNEELNFVDSINQKKSIKLMINFLED